MDFGDQHALCCGLPALNFLLSTRPRTICLLEVTPLVLKQNSSFSPLLTPLQMSFFWVLPSPGIAQPDQAPRPETWKQAWLHGCVMTSVVTQGPTPKKAPVAWFNALLVPSQDS